VKGRRTVGEIAGTIYSAVTFHEMYKIAAQGEILRWKEGKGLLLKVVSLSLHPFWIAFSHSRLV